MNTNNLVVFFRNDDVRNILDESLVSLSNLCIKHHVPISHAVEPANLSTEVAEWLITTKKQHPDLIEIIQHGYNHNCSNPHQKFEFGGDRNFEDQFNDIKKGKEILDKTFGNLWNPVFTFPYGTFNQETLKALDALEYEIISSKIKFDLKARLKNATGKMLGQDMILGKKINFHPDFRKGYKFREISVSANLIKKYTGESTAIHFSLDEIMEQVMLAAKYTNVIGILFHHRFHGDHLNMTEKLILLLKEKGYRFSTFKDISS